MGSKNKQFSAISETVQDSTKVTIDD